MIDNSINFMFCNLKLNICYFYNFIPNFVIVYILIGLYYVSLDICMKIFINKCTNSFDIVFIILNFYGNIFREYKFIYRNIPKKFPHL